MTTKTKRGGPRPGAGRKRKQAPLRERAEAARLQSVATERQRKREQMEALKNEARITVARVLGVPDTEWVPSDGENMVETVVEGLRFQYDLNDGDPILFVWGFCEDGDEGWQGLFDLADLGEFLAKQPLDTTDDEARTAAMRVTLPDVD
jgi:hypothetical protein